MAKKTKAELELDDLATRARLYYGSVNWQRVGSLRLWYVAEVPMKAFYIPVKSVAQAKMLARILFDYDTYLEEHKKKPEFQNACGLQVYYERLGWREWTNGENESFSDVLLNESLDRS